MFKRELGVSCLLDLDHQRHSSFGAAKRERLTCVLERDRVDVLAVAIRTPLDHAPTKLRFLVGIMKINDGERDTRVTPGVLRLKRAFSRADQYAIIVDVPEISADDRENLRYSKCCISRMS